MRRVWLHSRYSVIIFLKPIFGLGDDFDNTYTLDYKETFIYEYGEGASIVNVRSFYDTFAPDDAQNYETRTLYKYEYVYDGKRIMKNRIYQVNNHSESSWDLINERGTRIPVVL